MPPCRWRQPRHLHARGRRKSKKKGAARRGARFEARAPNLRRRHTPRAHAREKHDRTNSESHKSSQVNWPLTRPWINPAPCRAGDMSARRPQLDPLLEPDRDSGTRRARIGPISLLLYSWVVPLLRRSWKSQLSEDDLLPLWMREDVAHNANMGELLWDERPGSFGHLFWQMCGGHFIIAGVLRMLADGCAAQSPP